MAEMDRPAPPSEGEPVMQARQAAPEPLHYTVIPTRAAEVHATLPPEARRVLRLCDGTRTFDSICDAIPGDTTPRILRRLESLGLIAAKPAGRRRRDTPHEVLRWMSRSGAGPSLADAVEAAAPALEEPAPVAVESAASVVAESIAAAAAPAAPPVVEAAPPVVEAAPPVVEAALPVVEAAPPVVEAARPVVEAVAAVAPPVVVEAPRASEPAFSDAEEAFFATPLPDELPWDFDAR
jgi:hypothetical protein